MSERSVENNPKMFTPDDRNLMDNIPIAQMMCARAGENGVRYMYMTEHGWGSVIYPWHLKSGTFYMKVTRDWVDWDNIQQVPRFRESATAEEIRTGKAERYRDPIDSPHISGIYSQEDRWVKKENE